MTNLTIAAGSTSTITNSETDNVTFMAGSRLDVTGTADNPIQVMLSSTAVGGALNTIGISYATVSLAGISGVSTATDMRLGPSSTLVVGGATNLSAGSTVHFGGAGSHLVLGSLGLVSALSGIYGFGPNSSIDVPVAATSLDYLDNANTGTGGTIKLRDAGGNVVLAVPLASGNFTTASFALQSDGQNGTVIDLVSHVTSVATTSASTDLRAGQVLTFTLATSDPVVVTGNPKLLLSKSSTAAPTAAATFDPAASSSGTLVFRYTVAPGDDTPNLYAVGVAPNGATITNTGGGPVDLSAVTNPTGIQVDTVAPAVSSLADAPTSGTLRANQAVTISLSLSEAVAVSGGTPTLSLNDGGTATFDPAASTATTLVFRYVVQPGQNQANLAVAGLNLNGATIVDGAGNGLFFAGSAGTLPGTLVIDTLPPTVASIAATPSDAVLGSGQVVRLTLTMSEPVVVTGSPRLMLSNGGIAILDPASTPTSLVFSYTVQPGQVAADLAVTGLDLNGGIIADPAGNALDPAAIAGNPPGVLAINGNAPLVLGVTASPANAVLGVSGTVSFTVALSEPVTVVGGVPRLLLNDGGFASFDPASSGTPSLVFTYTAQPGQNTADLAVTGVQLNGALATDLAGNALDLAAAVSDPSGIIQVDTLAPVVAGLVADPGSGILHGGQTVAITLSVSEAVIVAGGVPTLQLSDGGMATFDAAASTPTALVFDYTVQLGANAANLAVAGLLLNGATIADPAGNALNPAGAVGALAGFGVDTVAPIVTGLSTDPATGTLHPGENVSILLDVSEAVALSGGSPTLGLNNGGTATLDAAHSTPTQLVFTYTVQDGQDVADLAVTGLALHGATVADLAGNALDLAGAVGNPVGTLRVDTTTPQVVALTTDPVSGSLGAGRVVNIALTLDRSTTIAGGMPSLNLSDGGTAAYDPANSTATVLAFTHTVQPGQNTPDLAITGLVLGGATITDAAGTALDPAAAIGNPAGILRVDTTRPTVTALVTTPDSGSLDAGQSVSFVLTLSEPISVSGGSPALLLNDGDTAVFDAAASNPASLVFTQQVRAGQAAADLCVIGFDLNGATLADQAGNTLDTTGAVGNPPGLLAVDAVAASVLSVAATPGTGTVTGGQTVAIDLTFSKPVVVAGTPTLTLNDGGSAQFDPASSTATTLRFLYTVQPDQTAANLSVTGMLLGSATVTDAYGQPVDLGGATASLGLGVTGTATPSTPVPSTPVPSTPDPSTPDPSTPVLDTPTASTPTTSTPDPSTIDSSTINPSTPVSATPTPSTPTPSTPVPNTPVASASNPGSINVYRFFDSIAGTHFYTSSAAERDAIMAARPDLVSEGTGLRAVDPTSDDPDAVPVYRFFDKAHGTQFLTASAAERDEVISTRPDLTYENGDVFYEHLQPHPGDTPVYRYFDTIMGTHFYTDSASERASITQTRPDLTYEGVGFYEPS